MAQRTSLAAVLNGLVRNVDLTADELVLDSVRLGGLTGTLLTKAILDSLIANSHAPGSDNQNIVAGAGLSGGGTGATVTLDVNVDNSTIEISTDTLRLKDGAVSAAKLAATAITGQTLKTTAPNNADTLLIYDSVDAALRKITYSNLASSAGANKVSKSGDTMSGNLNFDTSGSNNITGLGLLGNFAGQYVIDLVNLYLQDSSGTPSVDWNNRALVNPSGGVALEWLTVGAVSLNSNKISNLATGTLTNDAVNKGQMDAADALKLSLSGGTMSGNIAMGGNKIIGLGAGTNPTDAINLAQLQAAQASLFWLKPVSDPDLVSDEKNTPPTSPVADAVYIAAASPTGAWAGKPGHAFWYNSFTSTWIDLLGRAVIVGDRFGVTLEHASGFESGGLVGKHNYIAQITDATPGAIVYNFIAPNDQDTIFVNADNSNHFGHQYTYRSDITTWIEFGGVNANNAGIGLSFFGNVLNVNLGAGIAQLPTDNIGIDVKPDGGLDIVDPTSGLHSTANDAQLSLKLDGTTLSKSTSGLKVAALGITNSEIATSAAIDYSKLNLAGSIVDADISASAAISYSKLNLTNSIVAGDITADAITTSKILDANVTLSKLASNSVDENKIKSSALGSTLSGGSGTVINVVSAPLMKKSMVAGESFAANTSFLVRFATSAENAGRVYKATSANALVDNKFWSIGIAIGTGQTAGAAIDVIVLGTHTLASSDTAFNSADLGKAVWLTTAGGFSVTAPSTTGTAAFKVGTVEDTNKIFIDGKQLTGIN